MVSMVASSPQLLTLSELTRSQADVWDIGFYLLVITPIQREGINIAMVAWSQVTSSYPRVNEDNEITRNKILFVTGR